MGTCNAADSDLGQCPMGNVGSDCPGTSFKDQVSKYGYSNSSPLRQSVIRMAGSSGLQIMSPSPKRKRSQVSELAESPTPKRRIQHPDGQPSSTSASLNTSVTPIVSKLCDTLRPNLTLVLIGLNPGIMTANLGHPYAHPSNGFWKILHTSGITPVQHRPQDHPLLPDLYGIGNTNICARPSRQGSDLTKAELAEGAKILDEKMATYRPEAACISGKGVWEAVWCCKTGKKKMPKDGEFAFRYGWQAEELWLGRIVDGTNGEVVWKGSKTFVAPSTSGLNAGMSTAAKEEAWRPMGEWMMKKRSEREAKKTTGKTEVKSADGHAIAAKELDFYDDYAPSLVN